MGRCKRLQACSGVVRCSPSENAYMLSEKENWKKAARCSALLREVILGVGIATV